MVPAAVSAGVGRAAGVVYGSTSPGDRSRRVEWGNAASQARGGTRGARPTAPPREGRGAQPPAWGSASA